MNALLEGSGRLTRPDRSALERFSRCDRTTRGEALLRTFSNGLRPGESKALARSTALTASTATHFSPPSLTRTVSLQCSFLNPEP